MPTPKLRGNRLLVVRTLRDGSKTASEVGKAADKPTGSLFGLLKRMVGDGIVHADTGTPRRGTLYSLTDEGRAALEATERASIVPGKLTGQQQLLLIEQLSRLTDVQKVLADDNISGCVVWAAEVNGGWILAVDGESSFPTQRLTMAIEEAGGQARALLVNDLLSGDELHDRAVWLLDDVGQSV